MTGTKRVIGVLTSGGDAPGMNAAVRSVVRCSVARGWTVVGVHRGYHGLCGDDMEELGPRSVSNIVQRGGTILHTARCDEFETRSGLETAREVLERREIDGLVLIGGDGTFRGAVELSELWDGQLVGVPGTIDNDLWGTDQTIGFDTAVNTALAAIDKIRDTAEAHERTFLVEVMGRRSGYIALEVGIGGGAEEIVVPESPTDPDAMLERLAAAEARGKTSSILVIAEGGTEGGALKLAERLERTGDREHRVTILGHIQRGGAPSARDRVLATKLGAYAVEVLGDGGSGVMVGEVKGELVTTPFRDCWEEKKPLDDFLMTILPDLAR